MSDPRVDAWFRYLAGGIEYEEREFKKSMEKIKREAADKVVIKCPECKGSGEDENYKWPDGSNASCVRCDGYGEEPGLPAPREGFGPWEDCSPDKLLMPGVCYAYRSRGECLWFYTTGPDEVSPLGFGPFVSYVYQSKPIP